MAVTPSINIGTLITRTPGVRGGRPHIAGTGVSVRTIVSMENEGMTPQQIVEQMPHLSLAHVHAALAYYYANKAQLDAEMSSLAEEEAQLEAEWRKSRDITRDIK